jgi:hypothetical protein
MNCVFNWLYQNKEWIFSGIGVAVLLLILEFFRRILNRNNNADKIRRITESYVDILDNKRSGHSGIPGLIQLGAAKLRKNKDVLELCAKIEEHGKPNPLDKWILKHIKKDDILKFIKWQSDNEIGYSPYYFNENNFILLVERYLKESKQIKEK